MIAVFEKENLCERAKKNKRDFFFFFSCETYTKVIVIDLIIVKLFGICPVVFPAREMVFHVNFVFLCVLLFWIDSFFFFF